MSTQSSVKDLAARGVRLLVGLSVFFAVGVLGAYSLLVAVAHG